MAPSRAISAAPWAVAIVLAGFLAACAGSPLTAYDLKAATASPGQLLRAEVRVLPPTAIGDLDSDRILVRTGPDAQAVLAGARWANRLPVLVQSVLRSTFENASGQRLAAGGGSTAPDYNLETVVRAFDLDAPARQVVIDFEIKVVSASTGRIVAERTFKAQSAVSSTDAEAVTAAFSSALEGVMPRLVAFVAASL